MSDVSNTVRVTVRIFLSLMSQTVPEYPNAFQLLLWSIRVVLSTGGVSILFWPYCILSLYCSSFYTSKLAWSHQVAVTYSIHTCCLHSLYQRAWGPDATIQIESLRWIWNSRAAKGTHVTNPAPEQKSWKWRFQWKYQQLSKLEGIQS